MNPTSPRRAQRIDAFSRKISRSLRVLCVLCDPKHPYPFWQLDTWTILNAILSDLERKFFLHEKNNSRFNPGMHVYLHFWLFSTREQNRQQDPAVLVCNAHGRQ